MVGGREVDNMSVVGVFDPLETENRFPLGSQHVRQIEESLNEITQGGEGLTERGQATIISLPRRLTELLIERERLEVRTRRLNTTVQDAGAQLADLFSAVFAVFEADPKKFPWVRTGYNFVVPLQSKGSAARLLASGLFRPDLEAYLGSPIQGASAWLWLTVGDATLWLRLEPHRNDPSTSRIMANANFTEEEGMLPPEEGIAAKLTGYWERLNQLLDKIGV